jgi:hypothetical protein
LFGILNPVESGDLGAQPGIGDFGQFDAHG